MGEAICQVYDQRMSAKGPKRTREVKRSTDVVTDSSRPPTVIVDIDGTLAIHQGRSPYDWAKVSTDKPNEPVVRLVKLIAQSNSIVFVTGRDEVCRKDTQAWLDSHVGVEGQLFMRPQNDDRPDAALKRQIYDSQIKDSYDVWLVIDDRKRVVNMWRKKGLVCAQVAKGDF